VHLNGAAVRSCMLPISAAALAHRRAAAVAACLRAQPPVARVAWPAATAPGAAPVSEQMSC
jgi:hypothetical protein